MSCERPILAYVDERSEPHKVIFDNSRSVPESWRVFGLPDGVRSVQIPCGRCFLCRQSRAYDILVRAVAESRMYDFSSFVTLTVDDDRIHDVFPFRKLVRRPYQLFLKRLRKCIGRFRYLLCGEYGSLSGRPHYHLIIFGRKFVDGFIRSDDSWCDSYVLQQCWPYGHITCSEVCNERLAYVSGYQLKGDFDDVDFPQFVVWSRRPGLGASWFDKYWSDLCINGFTFVLGGKERHISCRYFFERLRLHHPEEYAKIKLQREKELEDETHIMRHSNLLRKSQVLQYRKNQRKKERLI